MYGEALDACWGPWLQVSLGCSHSSRPMMSYHHSLAFCLVRPNSPIIALFLLAYIWEKGRCREMHRVMNGTSEVNSICRLFSYLPALYSSSASHQFAPHSYYLVLPMSAHRRTWSDCAGSEAGGADWWSMNGKKKKMENELGGTVAHSSSARLGMKRRTPTFQRVQIIIRDGFRLITYCNKHIDNSSLNAPGEGSLRWKGEV